jgi:hypothetical protein
MRNAHTHTHTRTHARTHTHTHTHQVREVGHAEDDSVGGDAHQQHALEPRVEHGAQQQPPQRVVQRQHEQGRLGELCGVCVFVCVCMCVCAMMIGRARVNVADVVLKLADRRRSA